MAIGRPNPGNNTSFLWIDLRKFPSFGDDLSFKQVVRSTPISPISLPKMSVIPLIADFTTLSAGYVWAIHFLSSCNGNGISIFVE